jgi:hypothetical protein
MTDDFKERLRNTDHNWHAAACAEAEHRIEAQAEEIGRLREALMVCWLKHDEPTTVDMIASAALAGKAEQ